MFQHSNIPLYFDLLFKTTAKICFIFQIPSCILTYFLKMQLGYVMTSNTPACILFAFQKHDQNMYQLKIPLLHFTYFSKILLAFG